MRPVRLLTTSLVLAVVLAGVGCGVKILPQFDCLLQGCPLPTQRCQFVPEGELLPGAYKCVTDPEPSPTPSPTATPTPTPTAPPVTLPPSPVPTPTPAPTPEPTPTPKPPKPSPSPSPCTLGCPPSAWQCKDKQEWEVKQGNWLRGPAGAPYTIFGCPPGVPEAPGCAGGSYLNKRCDRVDQGGRVLAPAEDGWFGICVPQPCPSPGPTPSPTPTPSPAPGGGTCPEVLEYGSSSLGYVDCGKCRELGYVGYRMNWTATPLRASTPEDPCPDGSGGQKRQRCETPKACQDPTVGATIYMSLQGGWQDGLCEPKSENQFNCGHKPTHRDLGITTIWACPKNAPPNHPKCGQRWRVDVRADKPVVLGHAKDIVALSGRDFEPAALAAPELEHQRRMFKVLWHVTMFVAGCFLGGTFFCYMRRRPGLGND